MFGGLAFIPSRVHFEFAATYDVMQYSSLLCSTFSRELLMRNRCRIALALLLLIVFAPKISFGQPQRAARPDSTSDIRHGDLKDLNGYFPFRVPESLEAWEVRAERVRRQLLVSQGLWPLPDERSTPPTAVIHGRRDLGDYFVEKAYIETLPGFYLTGSLYRPKDKAGPFPAVLSPHGHWQNGRFYDAGEKKAADQVKIKAEEFAETARSPLQARCVHLARMGFVVFHYDMIGYADNTQIPSAIAHGFAKQRPTMNSETDWGLFSPQAESHSQNVMGLQTWNSLRAFDFVSTLPDVDPARIGVTGASGGGTQTFMLAAIEPRVKLAMPCVMVSTAMQGGCTCENSCGLRVGTGNIELAALFAPKPMGLTSADDWTKEISTKGYPELQKLYRMYGKEELLSLHDRTEFKHNYNLPSRQAMYERFSRHLLNTTTPPPAETEFQRLTTAEMTVWNEQHPRPAGGEKFERALLRNWHTQTQKKLAAVRPKPGDPQSLSRFRTVVGGAVDVLIGRKSPAPNVLTFESTASTSHKGYRQTRGVILNTTNGERVPVVMLKPDTTAKSVDSAKEKRAVLWIHPQGKSSLFREGKLRDFAHEFLKKGVPVVGIDLLFQGDSLPDGKPMKKTRRVKNPREAAAYTFGYNHSVFAKRTHDILTAISFMQKDIRGAKIHLAALNGAGHWGAAALAQAGSQIEDAALDTDGFRFRKIDDLHDMNFLPGGARYYDLPGFIALSRAKNVWLAGDVEASHFMEASLLADPKEGRRLVTFVGQKQNREQRGLRWLMSPAAREVY